MSAISIAFASGSPATEPPVNGNAKIRVRFTDGRASPTPEPTPPGPEPPQVTSVLTSYASGSGTLSFVEISGDSGAAYAWDDATHSLTVDEEIENGN